MTKPLAETPVLPSEPVLPRGLFSRPRIYFLAGIPVVALLFAGSKWVRLPGGDHRIVTHEFRQMEAKLERRLYAPTALPAGLNLQPQFGPRRGAHRIMQAYLSTNADQGFILAQEPRHPERDAYNRRVFVDHPDRKVDLNGKQGYIVTGQSGERRLFWQEDDAILILSSANLPDETLVEVALNVRRGPER